MAPCAATAWGRSRPICAQASTASSPTTRPWAELPFKHSRRRSDGCRARLARRGACPMALPPMPRPFFPPPPPPPAWGGTPAPGGEGQLTPVQKPHLRPCAPGALGIGTCHACAQALGGGVAQDDQNVLLLCHRRSITVLLMAPWSPCPTGQSQAVRSSRGESRSARRGRCTKLRGVVR